MFKIGINTNCECGKGDNEILSNIKNAGFENVMLSYKAQNIEKSIDKIHALGLNISYFHTDNNRANDLWAVGESAQSYIESIIAQIEMCSKHKIPIAVMHATKGSPSDFALPPNKQGLKNFQEILKVANKNNVKIALENIDCFSIKHLYFLLENFKDKNLGFCYDSGHHHLYNPKTDLLKKYAGRLFALHLHDNLMDWRAGFDHTRDLHLLPFDGKIDFTKVCKKLKNINYQGVIMLEVHKKVCGKPQLYEKMKNKDYLIEAYKRAEKIAQMLEWIFKISTGIKLLDYKMLGALYVIKNEISAKFCNV